MVKRENFIRIPQISLYHSLVSLHTQELRISFVLLTIIIECHYYHRMLRNTQLALRARTQVQKLLLLLHGNPKSSDSTSVENVEVSVKLVWRIIWSGDTPSVAMLRLLGDLTHGNESMVTTYAAFCADALIRKHSSLLAVKVLSVLLNHLRPRTGMTRTVLSTIRKKIGDKGSILELLKSELKGHDEDVAIEYRLNLIRQAVHTFELHLSRQDVESVWNRLDTKRELRSKWLALLLEDLSIKTRDEVFDHVVQNMLSPKLCPEEWLCFKRWYVLYSSVTSLLHTKR